MLRDFVFHRTKSSSRTDERHQCVNTDTLQWRTHLKENLPGLTRSDSSTVSVPWKRRLLDEERNASKERVIRFCRLEIKTNRRRSCRTKCLSSTSSVTINWKFDRHSYFCVACCLSVSKSQVPPDLTDTGGPWTTMSEAARWRHLVVRLQSEHLPFFRRQPTPMLLNLSYF